jgi:alanine dehydrogenase
MNIGVPKERRPFEFRVGLTPIATRMLVEDGHTLYIEHNAGVDAGFLDQDYEEAGGRIAYSAHEVFARADLVTKVARPIQEELEWLRPEAIVAGLLHLGSARQEKTDILLEKEITAFAFEQVQLPDGDAPIRRPLSQIGGTLCAQIAARLLQNDAGGKGILMGGLAGVPPAEVVIIGGGIAGTAAVKAFLGMGAQVTVLDVNINVLQRIHDAFPGVVTMLSYSRNLERVCSYADILVGTVLVPDAPPPIVITRRLIKLMRPRSIIMDFSIDEGGCVETSRPTTHEHPTFIEEGIIHYCVPNIPSVVARTATNAYLNAAFPYIRNMANKGIEAAASEDPTFERGIAIHKRELRHITRLTPKTIAE